METHLMHKHEQILRIIAENLNGQLQHTVGADSSGNEWKQWTIKYEMKNKNNLDKTV